jgi:hypothetical protein
MRAIVFTSAVFLNGYTPAFGFVSAAGPLSQQIPIHLNFSISVLVGLNIKI